MLCQLYFHVKNRIVMILISVRYFKFFTDESGYSNSWAGKESLFIAKRKPQRQRDIGFSGDTRKIRVET